MAMHYLWWIAGVILVIAELMTGSLYLLAVAVGAAAAGLAALIGQPIWVQFLVAAVLSVGASALVQKLRGKRSSLPTQENPDVLLDVGSPIFVSNWQLNHATRVQHRGTDWDARSRDTAPAAGWHKIVAIENNQLILARDVIQAQ
jgi:membrane protein implicated in regulation of membrane protease activity